MVHFMENPNLKWMRTGGTPISGNPHVSFDIPFILGQLKSSTVFRNVVHSLAYPPVVCISSDFSSTRRQGAKGTGKMLASFALRCVLSNKIGLHTKGIYGSKIGEGMFAENLCVLVKNTVSCNSFPQPQHWGYQRTHEMSMSLSVLNQPFFLGSLLPFPGWHDWGKVNSKQPQWI